MTSLVSLERAVAALGSYFTVHRFIGRTCCVHPDLGANAEVSPRLTEVGGGVGGPSLAIIVDQMTTHVGRHLN